MEQQKKISEDYKSHVDSLLESNKAINTGLQVSFQQQVKDYTEKLTDCAFMQIKEVKDNLELIYELRDDLRKCNDTIAAITNDLLLCRVGQSG